MCTKEGSDAQKIATRVNAVNTDQQADTAKREFLKSSQMSDATLSEAWEEARAKTHG